MNVFGNIVNIIFSLIEIIIVVGIVIRVCKDKFSTVKEVPATVIDKQKYQKRVYRKSQAPFNKTECVITFLCDNKKLYFDVSEFSYAMTAEIISETGSDAYTPAVPKSTAV